MALDYGQISAITEKKFIPKLVDNIFDSNPLLQRAKSKFTESIDGGERIVVPLNYAQATAAGWYSGADTLNITDNDAITAAAYTWKNAYASIVITNVDEKKNSGAPAIVKLVRSKVQIAEKTLADQLGTGLYNDGTTTDAIVGLRAIVNTSSTVGGISQSSYSWWQGQLDSSTTTLSLAAMQTQFNAATIGNDSPTVIVTTRAIYNYFYALLQPQQRFVDTETAKAGFASLMFNGTPVIVDSHCPANNMFMINEKYLHFFVHSAENFRFKEFSSPVNQAVNIAHIFWMGALGSSNNRMHARLSAITA